MKNVISYQTIEKTAVITFNNPPVNALGHAVRSGVIENLKRNEIKAEQNERDIVMVAHIGDDALRKATTLASQIRRHGGAAMVGPSRGLRSQLRYATSVGASHAVIIGDDEISTGAYKLRNLRKSDQSEATAEEILAFFSSSKD